MQYFPRNSVESVKANLRQLAPLLGGAQEHQLSWCRLPAGTVQHHTAPRRHTPTCAVAAPVKAALRRSRRGVALIPAAPPLSTI